jgi:pimeloyl-ACP methyl ester carboxylesterase
MIKYVYFWQINKTLMNVLLALAKYLILPGLALYLTVVLLAYFFQEKLLFAPRSLPESFRFTFPVPFEEIYTEMPDGAQLHGILFPVQTQEESSVPRLIFYLHGNAGALDGWGNIAPLYAYSGYDMFIPDYRGFGKSTGRITSQDQFLDDIRRVFRVMEARYGAENIVVVGYSLGGAAASQLAREFPVRKLVLKSTFHSLLMVKASEFAFLPNRVMRYRFNNAENIRHITAPILLVHGDRDEIIPVEHAEALAVELKPSDTMQILTKQTHNGLNHNPEFHAHMRAFLESIAHHPL